MYRWAGLTDVGKTRTENQDSVLPAGSGEGSVGVVAVADGLGGHPGGDIASQCVIDAIRGAPADMDASSLVRQAHSELIATIAALTVDRKELIAMATTLTLAVLSVDRIVEVAHVGDSRAYIHDGTDLVQITDDHTHGMDRVVAGDMTEEEARTDPDWHVLSNWLGFESYRVATHRVPMSVADRLLLCTDGLSNMVDDARIAGLLATGSPSDAAEMLVAEANRSGGLDNISVVVVEAFDNPAS